MKTITNEDKLAEVGRMIQRNIENAKRHLAEGMQEATEDFCYFFHWHAADTYAAQKRLQYFTEMLALASCTDITAVTEAIKNRIKNIENELINCSAFGTCTNEVVNLEHRIDLDSKRTIREHLLNMLWVLEN